MIEQNFIKLYEESFKKHWDLPALTDYKEGNSYTYGQLAQEIARLHLLFSELGIEKGDKISLIGKNHSSWSIVFMATVTFGAVIVPILHEFNEESMEYIIDHSDSKLVFINDAIWKSFNKDKLMIPIFELSSFSLLKSDGESTTEKVAKLEDLFYRTYPNGFSRKDICYAEIGRAHV